MPAPSMEKEDAEVSGPELVASFRVLDGVADLLGMIGEGREASVAAASAALHARFVAADALLDSLPGADMTRAAQLAEAQRLIAVLESKRKLVAKHSGMALLDECLAKQNEPANSGGEAARAGGFGDSAVGVPSPVGNQTVRDDSANVQMQNVASGVSMEL